jgi:regulatory protein
MRFWPPSARQECGFLFSGGCNMAYRITAINAQKRNPNRVNIHLDGEFAFGLQRITAAWLSLGQELDDEKIARLKAEDGKEVAYQKALNFLSYRQRSLSEIQQRLKEHEIAPEVIEYVLERLKNAGLVNDEQFAQRWAENRAELRPRSRRALAQELRQHGVDQQTIDETLTSFDDDELAYQAALRRAPRFEGLEWKDFRMKLFRYLAQRGFNYETSSQAIARVWETLQATRSDTGEEGHL